MRHSSRTRSISQSLGIALVAAFVILGVYDAMLPQAVLACPGPTDVTYPGTEAYASTITLQMPFIAGETWTVGGVGSFYGNNEHCNDPNNDYYATDWNRTNDDGAVGSRHEFILKCQNCHFERSNCHPRSPIRQGFWVTLSNRSEELPHSPQLC